MGLCGILLNFYFLFGIGDKDRITYSVDVLLSILVFIIAIMGKIPATKDKFYC